MPDDVLDMIGTAAALEQLAEESAELAQAALKMARKLRGENPTPKSRADCIANLQEEIADVELCISILPAALHDPAEVGKTMAVYRQAGTAMIAGAQRLAYSRGPEKYSFSVPSEKHRHLHTVDRTDAVALLMQAGSLALGEMDALRECKAKTAAANLYRAMIGF